jgi:hypothetical protein
MQKKLNNELCLNEDDGGKNLLNDDKRSLCVLLDAMTMEKRTTNKDQHKNS